MSATIAPKPDDRRILHYAAAGLVVIAGALFAAAAQPFASLGVKIDSGAARAALLFAMGVIGLFASARAGLQLWPENWGRVWRVGLLYAAGTAIFVVVIDCFVFRQTLTPDYVAVLRQPLWMRLVYFSIRAFTENTVYHLFALSILILAFGAVWHKADGSPSDVAFWAAIILSQLVNIVWNVVLFEPVTPFALGYDAIRYVAPGLLWGYLFWRYGFATAEIAHVATHFFLQPSISIVFR